MLNGLQLTLQQLMADWLANDPYFVDIPVITEFAKDIQGGINVALSTATTGGTGKAGLCLVIVTPLAESNNPDEPGPYFDKVKMVARVIENVPVNQDPVAGTGKRALDVAEFVHAVMKDFSSPIQNTNIVADRPAITIGNDPDNVTYDCLFIAHGGVSYVPNKVSDLVAQTDMVNHIMQNLHFTPLTAECWYSKDGSIPVPGVPLGNTDYGQSDSGLQIIVGAGHLFQARAVLAGYRSSRILSIQF